MRYISIIKSCYPSLSKAEKKVADYVLKERGNVLYQTLLEISNNINVGEATIIRFVKKIGFKGFQDLKLEIAKEDRGYVDSVYDNYVDLIAFNIEKAIENTKTILDISQLDGAVDAILNGKRIYFYGVGFSGITAEEAKSRFMKVGIIGSAITDTHFQMMYSSICDRDDVILAFSLSGCTKDILDSVEQAKKMGTKIIVVTSYLLSPITTYADYIILTSQKENPLEGGSMLGRISQLFIIDLLCTGCSIKNKEEYIRIKERTATAIINKIK